MKNESIVVVLMLMILLCFASYGVYGMYAFGWGMSAKRDEIIVLKADKQVLEQTIEDYKVAMNFEKLFLLLCKPDTITLLGDLEERAKDKAEFSLKKMTGTIVPGGCQESKIVSSGKTIELVIN